MAKEQHRHDISDRAWEKIRPHATLKTPLPSPPLSKSVVLRFDSLFIDDTIQTGQDAFLDYIHKKI